MKNFSFKN